MEVNSAVQLLLLSAGWSLSAAAVKKTMAEASHQADHRLANGVGASVFAAGPQPQVTEASRAFSHHASRIQE